MDFHTEVELQFVNNSIQCEMITIIDDNTVEFQERFVVNVESNDPTVWIFGYETTIIYIIDNDGMFYTMPPCFHTEHNYGMYT